MNFVGEEDTDNGACVTGIFADEVGTARGRRRRVAIVSHSNSLYGAGRSLLELVLSLRSMGLDVGVVLPQGGLLEQ